MLMADTMAVFFVVVGFMLSMIGLWLLAKGLWPERSDAAARRLERGLFASFLLGLPIALVALAAAGVASNLPGKLGGLTAGAILCLFVTYSSVGVSGLASVVGDRLHSQGDDASPWRATLRGAIVLVLAYLVPILGWFAILPISIVIGAGASTFALASRTRRETPAVVAHPSPVGVMAPSVDGHRL